MKARWESDEALVRQMQCSNPKLRAESWQRWFERDSDELRKYVCGRIGQWNSSHSEDILQECFLIGFINVSSGQYEDRGKPLLAYLKGIAHNLMLAYWRTRQRVKLLEESENRGERHHFSSPCIDEAIDLQAALRHALRIAQRGLSERRIQVLKMRFLLEKSSAEIGEELGISEGHVRQETYRALQYLRTHFCSALLPW